MWSNLCWFEGSFCISVVMLLCFRFRPLHLHILPLYMCFPGELHLGSGQLGGLGVVQRSHSKLAWVMLGRGALWKLSWELCCNGAWSAVPQEPEWLWTPSTVYAPEHTPAASLPYGTNTLSLAGPDPSLFGCVCAVFLLSGVLRSPVQQLSRQRPDAAWCWVGGTGSAWAQSLCALLHSAQRWAQQQSCIRAESVPCPTKAQTEFSLGLIALTSSQSLSNPSGLCYLALLGAQHRDNWASSTRCIHILCYMKVCVWMWIWPWSGLQS